MLVSRPSLMLAALIVVGCGSDPVEPLLPSEVAGAYVAVELTSEDEGTTTDELAAGASIELTLRTDGTTDGRFFIPEGSDDGSDYDVTLDGTWGLTGRTVTLDHSADTFLRDMDLLANGNT